MPATSETSPAPAVLDATTVSPSERRLYELWAEIRDLDAAGELMDWDDETQVPLQGHEARGPLSATLAALRHRKLLDPELAEILDACADLAEEGSVLAAQVRKARHDVDRAVRVPEPLIKAISETRTAATQAWRGAREDKDFESLAPLLERLIALKREEAAAIAEGGPPYDALIQEFEPGATEARLTPLFAELEERLAPLVRAVRESGVTVDETPARGKYPADRQEAFSRQLATAVGFDFDRGRLDLSTHPFCMGLHPTDVRLTWRYQEVDFRPAVFGVLHETGHGLYEQGLPRKWDRTPLGTHVSLGVHESQSRLWENHVGRSRGFWRWALPRFRTAFPDAGTVELDALWKALHTVRPTFIRVEADEATYNLHILVRFELEKALFAGDLEVSDLPAAWDDLYEKLLGIRPEEPTEGVLQDIHWPQALFGYFPTYTLGNLAAAQLFEAAGEDLGDLEDAFSRGELSPLLDWMRERIHRHGARYPAPELIERATGRPLSADPLMRHLERNAAEVYGV
jgi:carboxypeptidase Taq